jgi:hypothetical protein
MPLVFLLDVTLVSVNRPVTNDGVTFNVTPLPLEVLMEELIKPQNEPVAGVDPPTVQVGPFRLLTPVVAWPVAIAHDGVTAVELKLPLLCARASPDPNTAIRAASEKTASDFLIIEYGLLCCLLRHTSGPDAVRRRVVVTAKSAPGCYNSVLK